MSEEGGRGSRVWRTVTLTITNATKVVGVYLAVRNAAGGHDAVTYGVAAFMMAGAQVSEEAILAVAERFFGVAPGKEPEGKEKPRAGRR